MSDWVSDGTYDSTLNIHYITSKQYPMHLEIDFDNKIVIVLEEVEVTKLMNYIMTLEDWQEYTIDCGKIYVYEEEEKDDGFYTISLN